MEYEHLFQPLYLKNRVLKNRLFFGPVQTCAIDGDNYPTEYSIAFFGERAKGGASVVTIGDTPVDSMYAPNSYRHFILDDPGALPMLGELTDRIKEYGAVPSIELNHAGFMSRPEFLKGDGPIGPSSFLRPDNIQIKGMDKMLMKYTVESYCRAAAFAKLAGFEMCMICASDGWLLHQFLSPAMNHRTDRYGGSLENRMRFPMEVIRAVRKQVGPEFLLDLRLCAEGGGITPEEAVVFAKTAEPYVDMIQVNTGVDTSNAGAGMVSPTIFLPHLYNADASARIRKSVSIPVVTVGSVMRPEEAEQAIREKKADAVSMCRALIADPMLPQKARQGKENTILPCIRCLRCISEMNRTRRFRCSVNPDTGREFRLVYDKPQETQKRVTVIGGGVTGMIAALSAASRGCRVTLFEEKEQLGDFITRAEKLEHNADLIEWVHYLIRRVQETSNISLLAGIKVTPEIVSAQHADAVIAALGGLPIVNAAAVASFPNVYYVKDIYEKEEQMKGDVVIVGGGITGCDAAIYLAGRGHHVTLVDRNPQVLSEEAPVIRVAYENEMRRNGVEILNNMNCVSVNDKNVALADLKNRTNVMREAENTVFATGYRANPKAVEAFRPCARDFAAVGACAGPTNLMKAVFDAWNAGLRI